MANTKWNLDAAHSEVQFKVRHMMITNVTGSFSKFDATVETDGDDLTTVKATFTADVDSISTNNEQRDNHLKSPDFFDATNHPQLKFESTSMEKVDEENYKLHGNVTMRSTTHPITLDVEYGGSLKDPYGYIRAGFTITGKINRKEFGLNWSALTEAGGLVVSDDVKIHVSVEFIKEGSPAA
ncbi:MAG: YceI family protein [Taibaiella sp.]|nr:YceI family protein [Taibaiella sp.]